MNDKIFEFAKDPSCLMCLTPDNGGSWVSTIADESLISNIPRNFATEPATWYELKEKGLLIDPTHDFRFTFTFTLDSATLPSATTRYLMDYGSPVTAIFGALYANGGGISCCCGLFKSSLSGQSETAGEAITLIPNTVGVPLAVGEHTIEVYAIGNSLYAKLDEGDFVYAASMTRRTDLSILKKAPVTSHVGGVVKIELFDITDNKVIWSYPNIAEKTRLITKSNVIVDDKGAFSCANSTYNWSILTPCYIDSVPELTLIGKFQNLAQPTGYYQLVGSGNSTNYSSGSLGFFAFSDTSQVRFTRFYYDTAGFLRTGRIDITLSLDTPHVLAATFSILNATMKVFVDGELAGSTSLVDPSYPLALGHHLSIGKPPDVAGSVGTIVNYSRCWFVAAYNTVLSDDEIKQF